MLDKLFKFPVIRVDEENEEQKKRLSLPLDEEGYEFVQGEAEYPYFDFIGIEDAWIPNDKESFERARNKEFDCCLVKFANVHQMLVPWSKSKFKKEFVKFTTALRKKEEKENVDIPVIRISPDQLQKFLEQNAPDDREDIKEEDNEPDK